jgi:ribonuclease J
MHDLLRPQIVVPNHGEYRHLAEHTRLALSKGMTGIVAANGSMVELSGNAPQVVEYHEVGRPISMARRSSGRSTGSSATG